MQHYIYTLLVFIVGITGCNMRNDASPFQFPDDVTFDIVCKVVEYHFDPSRYGYDRAYLFVLGGNPPTHLIDALSHLNLRIYPGSRHDSGPNPYLFNVHKVEIINDDAYVLAQDFRDGFFWINYQYHLIRIDNVWEILEAVRIGD